jgi:hypothetical protein
VFQKQGGSPSKLTKNQDNVKDSTLIVPIDEMFEQSRNKETSNTPSVFIRKAYKRLITSPSPSLIAIILIILLIITLTFQQAAPQTPQPSSSKSNITVLSSLKCLQISSAGIPRIPAPHNG